MCRSLGPNGPPVLIVPLLRGSNFLLPAKSAQLCFDSWVPVTGKLTSDTTRWGMSIQLWFSHFLPRRLFLQGVSKSFHCSRMSQDSPLFSPLPPCLQGFRDSFSAYSHKCSGGRPPLISKHHDFNSEVVNPLGGLLTTKGSRHWGSSKHFIWHSSELYD